MEEKSRVELLNLGFTVEKKLKLEKEYISFLVIKNGEKFFAKCFKLREIFRDPSLKQWVNNEIDVAEKFASSGFYTSVLLLDKVYTNNILILFYEYYEHITLEKLISMKYLSDKDIKLILKDLLRILHDLRKMGLVHKHLSPDKILI